MSYPLDLSKEPVIYWRGEGREGWCKWGEGHYISCNQKREGHQKFKQGFGEGHNFVVVVVVVFFFVTIAVHLK